MIGAVCAARLEGWTESMSANGTGVEIAPQDLKLRLLWFGLQHPFRVVNLEEIAAAVGNLDKDFVREALVRLSQEGLVTRFSGRFCFNRPIPPDLRKLVEQSFFPSRVTRAMG